MSDVTQPITQMEIKAKLDERGIHKSRSHVTNAILSLASTKYYPEPILLTLPTGNKVRGLVMLKYSWNTNYQLVT